jgi:hypothetical protein
MPKTILNIAAGKFDPLGILLEKDPYFLVNLDTMYYQYEDPAVIEKKRTTWTETVNKNFYCNVDAFQFMERTRIMFDKVCIYRFLEHVSFTQVQYFIYLLSTITNPGAWLDIIVPNYNNLATMILYEDCMDPGFEANNILLTTELLNEPSCPHASIWTPSRAKYFMELEGRFRVKDIDERYKFDGRDIYLRFSAVRV